MKWKTLERNLKEASLVFVYDELGDDREKLSALRKLPALLRFGFEKTTHPKSWRKIDQWSTNQFEFDHFNTKYILLDNILADPTGDLVAITDQYYEDEYPIFSLSSVIQEYTMNDDRLLIAGNKKDFEPYGSKRPFIESPTVDYSVNYKSIYKAFANRYEKSDLEFPLRDSKNVFLQDNAILYELVAGDRLTSIEEVFRALPDAPYLPLWDTITVIFTTGVTQGTRLLDQRRTEGLAKWIRRRTELTYSEGLEISSYLNNLSRRHERLFNPYRRLRHPKMSNAYTRLNEIEIQDTAIQKRYQSWVSGGNR